MKEPWFLCEKITRELACFKYKTYLCIAFEKKTPGCSAVRLAHLLWEQGVEGSNPFTPTLVDDVEQALFACSTVFFIALTCISIWLCFS